MHAENFFKKPLQLIIISICICLMACANKTSSDATVIQDDTTTVAVIKNAIDTFPLKTIITHIACKNDASQSYAIYVPSRNTDAVIYFFDPHANGALPLQNYKALADKYNFILVGSNNSKNGNDFQTSENIWQSIFSDTQSRLQMNKNRIYVCGFSGGAKVASYIALHHSEIKAVIACGAGLPDGTQPSNFNFSFTGIAGKGDMNINDLVSFNSAFNQTQTKHRLILFNGKHEWSPPAIMSIAFAGLQFDAMRNNTIQKKDSIINAFIVNSKKRIDSCIHKSDWLQASNECALAINILDGITDVNFFKEENTSIVANAAYKNQLTQQQKIFQQEENLKAEYNAQFQQGNINYWNKTIADLNARSKTATAEGAMYQRLLAYLSLAFYSISNQLIGNNQNKEAEYFVTLYKTVDPTNSEAWYLSAIINARNNNAAATTNDLTKAVNNGFNDEQRLFQQHEFQNLTPAINFSAIESLMHK